MKTLAVQSEVINKSLRFNSSYHLSDGVLFERLIRQNKHELLENIASEIFTSGRVKRIYTEKKYGIPYLGNNDIRSIRPLSGCKHISRKYFNDEKSYLKEGMILTGRVGQDTVGSYTYCGETLEKTIGSDNVIRIIVSPKYLAGYVYAFLASEYGYALTRRQISGAAQPFITEQMLGQIPVPLLSAKKQEEINDLIVRSSRCYSKGNKLLNDAENEWIEKIGLKKEKYDFLNQPFERSVQSQFSISKNSLSIHTFRARNYSPRKFKIIKHLTSIQNNKLSELLERPMDRGGRFKRVEVSRSSPNAVELLNQADIFDVRPFGKTISKRNIKDWQAEVTKRNLILIPALGTLGEGEIFSRAQFCYGYLEDKTVAEGLLRLYPKSDAIDPAYMFLVLSSGLWFRILRNTVCGTNLLGYIYPLLNDYPIPRLGKNEERELGNKVRTAYKEFTEAIENQKSAISMIEKTLASWQK